MLRTLAASVAAFLLLAAGAAAAERERVQQPPFELVRAEGVFEVRAYPALAVVRTVMEGGPGHQAEAAFRRLFGYISGQNRGSDEIPMTAPVLQQPREGQGIPMTAPVLRQPGPAGTWEMLFVLPQGMSAETAPAPTDGAVSLGTLPARRVGVVTFDGEVDAAVAGRQASRLTDWLRSIGLTPAGAPEIAIYDQPGTPADRRRNEILVPLAGN